MVPRTILKTQPSGVIQNNAIIKPESLEERTRVTGGQRGGQLSLGESTRDVWSILQISTFNGVTSTVIVVEVTTGQLRSGFNSISEPK